MDLVKLGFISVCQGHGTSLLGRKRKGASVRKREKGKKTRKQI
jgi:hypothetical protein